VRRLVETNHNAFKVGPSLRIGASCGAMNLRLLRVKPRDRKAQEITDVIAVQMGQDHVAHCVRVDADQLKVVHRTAMAPSVLM